jgi:hypothetical protein
VAAHEFLFALEVSDDAGFGGVLADLTRSVLTSVGFGAPAIAELTATVAAQLADGAARGQRRCDLRFLAHAGDLQIIVACDGGTPWRMTRPLP